LAQIGTDRRIPASDHSGAHNQRKRIYQWGGDGGGVQFEFGGTDSATFSKPFSVAPRRSAFGGFGGRQATAERDPTSRPTSWLHGRSAGTIDANGLAAFGRARTSRNYQVKIPRVELRGQRIRLAGQGEAGVGGGKSGDLFLRVRLARHPDFSVEGSDLIMR